MEYILEIEDVLTKEFCEDVISRFEADENKMIGSTIGGINENIKRSIDLAISRHDVRKNWDDVVDKVGQCVNAGLSEYVRHVTNEGLDRCGAIERTMHDVTIGLPQIQKTEKNGFYTWHHDGDQNRIITYILYLNDVEDSLGGATEFLGGKKVQPKAGKLVLFPANYTYIHRGGKLKEGVKYILTNFCYVGKPIILHIPEQQVAKDEAY
uniref:2OG-Fe(II) oxygenase superfamily protein n=1 Tax=Ostreococcus mediterraneus virus 2 TaxID=2726183 RepID=A0A6H1QV37_9PHYC|nr:2OG-Fe(II) oxygenase superfamily protein [Ostreococcus mediterraneus virus 2]